MSISVLTPAEVFAGTEPRRPRGRDIPPPLPAIRPGQLWLIELSPTGAPSTAALQALDGVNVAIYDRALADPVALSLPLGAYAEPALSQDIAAERSVRFARDGWSVARLLPARLPQRERTRRVQDIVDQLALAKVAGRLPVTILTTSADGVEERFEARFDDVAAIVASHPRGTLLTIVIDAFGDAAAPGLHAVAANGLAG